MSSEHLLEWRRQTKKRLVDGLGGKCNKCGYNKCLDCLCFHHIDQDNKKFTIAKAMANPKAWNLIVEEVKKCILLCSICHGEFHAGLWELSEIIPASFCDLYIQLPLKKDTPTGHCVMCGEMIYFGNKFCSRSCAAKKSWKTNWPEKDVLASMLNTFSKCEIARQLGVSEAAVRKRVKKWSL